MAHIEIDRSQFPLVHVRFPAEGSEEDLRIYYQKLEELLREVEWVVFQLDLTALTPMAANSALRRAAARYFRPIRPLFDQKVRAEAVVIPNPLARGIYTAFSWLVGTRLKCPHKVFSTPENAATWLQEILARQSLASCG